MNFKTLLMKREHWPFAVFYTWPSPVRSSFLTGNVIFHLFHCVKMRPTPLIGCPSLILCSSSSIHLGWLHNMHQNLQFHPHHLFFSSDRSDALSLYHSFASCLVTSFHALVFLSIHRELSCLFSAAFLSSSISIERLSCVVCLPVDHYFAIWG